jgi:hypothetical protein
MTDDTRVRALILAYGLDGLQAEVVLNLMQAYIEALTRESADRTADRTEDMEAESDTVRRDIWVAKHVKWGQA